MLNSGEKMMAYEFKGYWKDVGTIDSLYEANMDLLGDKPNFDVADPDWKIQSKSPLAPPHFIADGGKAVNSIIMSGCEIFGTVENSILGSNVTVSQDAVVKNSIIMSDTYIGENTVIDYSIVDEGVNIGNNVVVGEEKETQKGITVLGRDITVADGVKVEGGKIIDVDLIKEGN
jgi:glucose-1-phosphate adenylyltransferase